MGNNIIKISFLFIILCSFYSVFAQIDGCGGDPECISQIQCNNNDSFDCIIDDIAVQENLTIENESIMGYKVLELKLIYQNEYLVSYLGNETFAYLDLEVQDIVFLIDNQSKQKYKASLYDENKYGRLYKLEKIKGEVQKDDDLVNIENTDKANEQESFLFRIPSFVIFMFAIFCGSLFVMLIDFSLKRTKRKDLYSILFRKRNLSKYLNRNFDEKKAEYYRKMVSDLKKIIRENKDDSNEDLKLKLLRQGWDIDIVNEALKDREG